MTVNAAHIAEVRRMVAEPDGSGGYTDAVLATLIEKYGLVDKYGQSSTYLQMPGSAATSAVENDNPMWIPTYDLNAAAAQIWEEKAAAVAADFDFDADGGDYKRSQKHYQFLAQARYYAARRSPQTITLLKYPDERLLGYQKWVINLSNPEDD